MQHILTQPNFSWLFFKVRTTLSIFHQYIISHKYVKKREIVSLFGSILQNETKKLLKT